ncbi:hypothetical protein PF005_g2589 [Phytophthora fragariae]|uniref:Uncharacterized protein n=1 Tax=Phytophthora fragariae TaxID=53985 RepID=A0A6A4AC57_9STRA|nr:hypothetical protein PF011_g1878 [Phytophthora fragariae]KAE9232762.1 hypothetical protein PF005_g2589 [Phytophthora fragariae]KAE9252672.1 hypothetical protein PF004_g1863 [Phytophthora fragariae]KAE9253023.1 hypothetical protein PF002_g3544 [Phytophthora fragariae]
MVSIDFRVNLGAFTISEKLIGFTYILKQVRVEPQTCNYDVNKAKRKTFAQELRKHMSAGNFIVY